MKIERFEEIEAWQLARELTRQVYRLTKKPGFEKDYGLKRQIQGLRSPQSGQSQTLEPGTLNL